MRGLGIRGDMAWLSASMAVWGLGFGLYGVIWPLYAQRLGATPVALGGLSTIAGLVTALVVLPGGWLTDRTDRKWVLFWGSALAVPVPLMFAWAPSWQWLIPGIVLYYGTAFSTPALQAYLRSETAPQDFSTVYNTVLAIFGTGTVLGPTIGGYLAQHFSYQLVFWISGGLYALSTALLLPMASNRVRLKGPSPAGGARIQDWAPRHRPRFFQWMLFMAGLSVIQSMVGPFMIPFLRTVGGIQVESLGILGSVGVLAVSVTAPFWGRLGERIGVPRTVGFGLFITVIGWILLLWNPALLPLLMVSTVVRGVGESSRGLVGVAVGRTVLPGESGVAYGLFNFTTEIAGAAAPLLGGILYQMNPNLPLMCATLLSGMVAWWLTHGLPGRPIPPRLGMGG